MDRARSSSAGFNPSRDDHGPHDRCRPGLGAAVSIPPGMITDPDPRNSPDWARPVSIPPGMITDDPRHRQRTDHPHVSIPPGMITDCTHGTEGMHHEQYVSIPPGMITDRRPHAPGGLPGGFNPSRDDHGPEKSASSPWSEWVSIPPGMITDSCSGGAGCPRPTCFNPSRDDHGPQRRCWPTTAPPRFNPSRDDHGRRVHQANHPQADQFQSLQG